MMRSKGGKIGWSLFAIVVLVVMIGGYFFLADSSAANKPWNPISRECSFKLNISSADQHRITEIVETVANDGYLTLLGEQGHLNQLGKIVDKDVPSLQFWGYIFSVPKLAKSMKKIQSESMKYNHFVESSLEGFHKESQQNECFYTQVEHFATFLKVDPKKTVSILKSCLAKGKSDKKALKPFLDYLISQKG